MARVAAGGVLPGVLFYLTMFAFSVLFHARAEYLGVEDDALTGRIMTLFEAQITAQQLGLLAVYAALGAAVGLVAWGFVDLARASLRRPYRWRRHLGWVVLLVFLVHSTALVVSMDRHPAIYEPQVANSLYLGVLFWLATELLPRAVIAALPWAFVALFVAMIGVLIGRRLRGRSIRLAAVARPAALGLLVGILVRLISSGAAPAVAGVGGATAPNVLLIAVDSLRADMLDRTPAVTPRLDAFARGAVSFDDAYSVMPRTFPAWASILTGKYPHHHGVRHMFPAPRAGLIIRDGLPALLGARGYRTAVVSDFAGDVFTRGDFGFAYVDAPAFTLASNVRLGGLKPHVHLLPYLVELARGRGTPDLSAFERLGDPSWLTDRALDWVDDAPAAGPFFLTVFYSSGHFPFAAPAPFYDRFTDPDYRGRSRFHKATIGSPLADPAARAAEERHIRGLYAGAVAASDDAIGALLDGLAARGVLDNTVVIITADHGEMLYEDGLGVGHGDHLYGRGTLNVPLLVRWPGLPQARAGVHVRAATPLIDLAPTVLGRLGLPLPEGVDGVDQGAVIDGRRAEADRPVMAETGLTFFPPETHRVDDRIRFAKGFEAFRFDPDTWAIYLEPSFEAMALLAKQRALIEGGRKLIYAPTRDGVRFELYDTALDPSDLRDLAAAEPERLEAMKAKLYALLLDDPGAVRLGDFVVPRGPVRAAFAGSEGP